MAFTWKRFQGGPGVEIRVTFVALVDDMVAALVDRYELELCDVDRVTLPTVSRSEIEQCVRGFIRDAGDHGGRCWGDNMRTGAQVERAERWAREQIQAAWPNVDWSV